MPTHPDSFITRASSSGNGAGIPIGVPLYAVLEIASPQLLAETHCVADVQIEFGIIDVYRVDAAVGERLDLIGNIARVA